MKRRDFLKVGMLGAAGFAFSGLTFMAPRRTHAANVVDITFVAEGVFKPMINGTDIYVWQFTDPKSSGPGELTSGLLVQEGDRVKDTVPVDVGECVDVILPVKQPGAYPLHTHFVPGVTANGTYLNPYGGALIVMSATG